MLSKNKVEIRPGQWVKLADESFVVTGISHGRVFLQEFARPEDLMVVDAPVTQPADKKPRAKR